MLPEISEEIKGEFARVLSDTSWLFDCMREAEDILEFYGMRPGRPSPFAWLAPPSAFRTMCVEVYVSHARELVLRWKTHRNAAPAALDRTMSRLTRAEVLAGLVETSLAAPLDELGTACYVKIFREIFPRSAVAPEFREPWPGAAEETIAQLTRKTVKRKES